MPATPRNFRVFAEHDAPRRRPADVGGAAGLLRDSQTRRRISKHVLEPGEIEMPATEQARVRDAAQMSGEGGTAPRMVVRRLLSKLQRLIARRIIHHRRLRTSSAPTSSSACAERYGRVSRSTRARRRTPITAYLWRVLDPRLDAEQLRQSRRVPTNR